MKPKIFNPKLHTVLSEALKGKAISRTLTNLFWRDREVITGNILDIGGGKRGSHYRFLPLAPGAAVRAVDIVPGSDTDFVLDITKEQVPLPNASQDYIFLFNILEHVDVHDAVLSETFRLLRPGGKVLGTIPFLVNVHPDPHDYVRFTEEALRDLFTRNGFSVEVIEPIGRGPFLAAYEQLDSLIPSLCHAILLPFVWLADALVQRLRPNRDFPSVFPLAYDFIVKKKVT